MKTRVIIPRMIIMVLFFHFSIDSWADEKSEHDFKRWERSISEFELKDQKQGVQKQGVLFVGSSSIRLWDLEKYFPSQKAINRGFGGSEIVDSTHFADRIILNHEPRLIFLYAGDNDLSRDRTAEEVAGDFQKFTEVIHKRLPKTRIVFIAIKPSLRRWELADTIMKANQLICQRCANHNFLDYADVWNPMLGADCKPRPELFKSDGLHLNHEGYLVWTKVVKPYLCQ
ncbi:SGNH/GDSL hydrolase family protein [Gimesia aquarii]|uniref:SGNH hydrolase-type esterase domain-containing protein n=1 Tax=Gimesia aquarii TaxID=2527964 RepID=A0A517VS16_9PLAN|nr:SGNH/GDSL hydrolase family protein [Gimesia aquarii]QDT95793.1 hypothetical protein V144x_12400 [Gimesia aquarii]